MTPFRKQTGVKEKVQNETLGLPTFLRKERKRREEDGW